MSRLTPVQVLTVLIERMEKQVQTYRAVNHSGYEVAIYELQRFTDMLRRAREYLEGNEL